MCLREFFSHKVIIINNVAKLSESIFFLPKLIPTLFGLVLNKTLLKLITFKISMLFTELKAKVLQKLCLQVP